MNNVDVINKIINCNYSVINTFDNHYDGCIGKYKSKNEQHTWPRVKSFNHPNLLTCGTQATAPIGIASCLCQKAGYLGNPRASSSY